MIQLSAVVVVGSVRERAQRVVDDLCRQTAADRTEIVLVDLGDVALPELRTSGPARIVQRRCRDTSTWGEARATGLRAATAPIVAFLEDHCFPASTWAEALIDAHRGPWAAVGYTFENANPSSYVSRASFVVDYGTWAAPSPGGEATFLQNNNISYKRALLLDLGLPLAELLETDWNAQEALKRRGHRLYLAGHAVASHHNFTGVREMLDENFAHCRAVAAVRRRRERWRRWRILTQGTATPLLAPPIRLTRLLRATRGREDLRRDIVRALPLIAVAYPYAALGEALGYLGGLGDSDRVLRRSLLDTERDTA